MGKFTVDAYDFAWISGPEDDPSDLCLHGHAVAVIGETRMECDCTVSAAALYLLKTLTEDHIIWEDNQMLPCCGFTYLPNETLDTVSIIGCCNGIDWTVLHDGQNVRMILEDETEVSVPLEEYQQEVFRFADKVEAYYKSCKPKIIPDGELGRNGYLAFWNEWHRLRGQSA